MKRQIIAAPIIFALTLEEAKSQCVVEHDEDNNLLTGFIKSAQDHIEGLVGFPLTETTLAYHFNYFKPVLEIHTPNIEASVITYQDADNVEQSLIEDTDYYLDEHSYPATITPVDSWPESFDKPNAIAVTVMAGTDDPAEVAAGLKQAMALLVGHWYLNREAEIVGTISAKVQIGLESILRRHGVLICA